MAPPEIDTRLEPLFAHRVIRALAERTKIDRIPCHLVGGAVRDALLGRTVKDFDAVVEGRGEELARALARELDAAFVSLGGKAFPAFRIAGLEFELDLWDRAGTTELEDLARRDFTVNSIAVEVLSREMLDPFSGLADLNRRVLRATTRESLSGDPLRVLRLARLAIQLDFEVDAEAIELARASAGRLREIAPERIRMELEKILGSREAARGIEILEAIGAMDVLFPSETLFSSEEKDGLSARLRRLEGFGGESAVATKKLARWAMLFWQRFGGGEASHEALATAGEAGYLPYREERDIAKLLEAGALPESEVEVRRFLYALGPELWPPAAVLLAARGDDDERSREILERLTERSSQLGDEIFDPPRLISGDEVRERFGLEGAAIGVALAAVRSAQVDGAISNREQAIERLQRRAATS